MFIRIVSVTFLVLCLAQPALCEMSSTNYRIPTSVLSGGGGGMGSTNYQMTSTLGQPSPLMDQANPPYSTSYALFPGFWYTLGAGIVTCDDLETFAASFGSVLGDANYCAACDFDEDGDVDGLDLWNFF